MSLPALRLDIKIRRARAADVDALLALIAAHTADGALLPRTRGNLLRHLGEFRLAWAGDCRIGCGALQAVDEDLAEVRSLAVLPEWRGGGIGGRLVEALFQDARRRGFTRVFCLTRRTGFFGRLGFKEVSVENYPHKVWNDCRLCPRRECCDETAMEMQVAPETT